MSAQAMGEAFESSPFENDHAKFLVHLAIADVVNDLYERRLWMHREGLAKKARVSLRTVDSALRELVEQGWLTVLEQGGGRGKETVYRYGKPRNGCEDSETLQPVQETLQSGASSQSSIPKNPTRAPAFLEDFERVWAAYPSSKDKQGALEKYQARRREGVAAEELQRAVENYARTRRGEEDRYTMHAATFFGPKRRWRDYLTPDQKRRSAGWWNAEEAG